MKVTLTKLLSVFIALAAWSIDSFAQVTTMYVMKNGEVVFQSPVSGVDNVTFDKSASGEALIVHKNESSPDNKIPVNNIQQLSFSDEYLSVETSTGNEVYAFSDIARLVFDNNSISGINNPPAPNRFDVIVSLSSSGGMTVQSPIAIKSLTLFSIDGRMISTLKCSGVETQSIAFLQGNAAGVYLLRVETEQGAIVKKVVKPLNK